jgi:hypothetical protein
MIGGALNNTEKTRYIVILMYSIIIVGIFMYITTKYYEESTRCGTMEKNYEDFPLSRTGGAANDYQPWFKNLRCSANSNISTDTWEYNNKCGSSDEDNIGEVLYIPSCLLNYHIKTAYNCCAVNTFKNSWVSKCALIHCLNAGARCLDFEIYSMDNKPVIGFSSRENNLNIKESFNKLDLHKALNIINNRAFTSETRQDGDAKYPIILNFRLKTKNPKVYDKMAKILYHAFGDRLLDPKYSYKNDKSRKSLTPPDSQWVHNMEGITDVDVNIPLICRNLNSDRVIDPNANNDFQNKVIVIINVTSILPGKSEIDTGIEFEKMCKMGGREGILLDYMNLLSPSPFCMHLRDFEVENATPAMKESLKDKSRYQLIFTTPTVGNSSKNVDIEKHHGIGAQMVGMCFQNYIKDRPPALSQITQYHNYFKEKGFYARKKEDISFTYKIIADPDSTPESAFATPGSTN